MNIDECWSPVNKRRPCPVCGKPDWCANTNDGAIRCERVAEPPPGWRVVQRCSGGGTIFRRVGNHCHVSRPSTPPTGSGRKPRIYPTREAAVGELTGWTKYKGAKSTEYGYTGGFSVVRFDLAGGGKDFRPVSRHPDGWRIADPPGSLPLYHLDELADAPRIFVGEGERVCEELRRLGVVATTSAHGSKAAGKSDWSALAGMEVIVLPDNDGPGRSYAEDVAAIATKLDPPARVKVVELPGLPDGGDVCDWVAHYDSREDSELVRMLDELVEDASEYRPTQVDAPDAPLAWRPFPVQVLPKVLCDFVTEAAKAIGCDPSMMALPALSSCAAVIGMTRRVRLKNSWKEPPIMWTAIVARSGTLKSPAFELAVGPLQRVELERYREYVASCEQYERDYERYEADHADWKRKRKDRGDPPEKPDAPVWVRHMVKDPTVESLAPILSANPRGLLLARDELSGWLGGFNQYKSGRGSDLSNWLELHRAGAVIVDRRTAGTIHIPHAAVSVCGTIQPGVLEWCLTPEYFSAGLPARILLACPPIRPKRWTEADLSPATRSRYEDVIRKLLTLEHVPDERGELHAKDLPLTPAAKARWVTFYNEFGSVQDKADSDDLAAAFSKIEGYVPRFALVFQLVGWATGMAAGDCVDDEAMEAAIVVARWFAREAERLYSRLSETEEGREARRLAEFVAAKGGTVAVRDVVSGCRWLGSAKDAKAALQNLVDAGRGAWRPVKPSIRGGAPSSVFCLSSHPIVSGTPTGAIENGGLADADSADAGKVGVQI